MMHCKDCGCLTTELSSRGSVKYRSKGNAGDVVLSYCLKCHLVYAE